MEGGSLHRHAKKLLGHVTCLTVYHGSSAAVNDILLRLERPTGRKGGRSRFAGWSGPYLPWYRLRIVGERYSLKARVSS